jgi:hypothetical protein
MALLRFSTARVFRSAQPITSLPNRSVGNLSANLVVSLPIPLRARLLREVRFDAESPLAGIFSTFFPQQAESINVLHDICPTGYSIAWPSPAVVTISVYGARRLAGWALLDSRTITVKARSVTTFSLPSARELYSRIGLSVTAPFTAFDIFGLVIVLPPLPERPPEPGPSFSRLIAARRVIEQSLSELVLLGHPRLVIQRRLQIGRWIREAEQLVDEVAERIRAQEAYDREFAARIPPGEIEERDRAREALTRQLPELHEWLENVGDIALPDEDIFRTLLTFF